MQVGGALSSAAANAGSPAADPYRDLRLDSWTLHRLRHSTLTHDAEGGTSTPMPLARSRHASVRSLERYAPPRRRRGRPARRGTRPRHPTQRLSPRNLPVSYLLPGVRG